MAKMSSDEIKKTIEEIQNVNKELEKQRDLAIAINNIEGARARQSEINANNERLANELNANSKNLTEEQRKLLNDINKSQKSINSELNKDVERRKEIVKRTSEFVGLLQTGWKYLQDQDKIIKNTIRNLGMSGTKADLMRGSFERSANFVTRLGGTLEDVQTIMEGFADETGRARVLSADMVKDITAIGRGTGLGIEQATKLGAQFEAMGISAGGAMDYVQGVVDTSERMGVNTTNVLKNISNNFKKLQTYNFQQGVKGFAQMAMHAEKFKVDISDALNAADTARTLEGAIDMVAQLQVMGGEFAKLDMFETLYFARNNPAKLQAKIGEMTKGIVTLRKNSEGTFEKFISPADRDRLAAAGKALGISNEKMTEMALRAFDIDKMSQQLAGMGLTDREKELIQGAAIMDEKTGKFQVELAGTMKDISDLTAEQARSFAKEQVLLEDRAKEAMTFDDTLKATIETLKASLLPILKAINTLSQPIKWLANLASSGWGGLTGAAAALLGAAMAWKIASNLFNRGVDNFIKGGVKNIFSGKEAGGGFMNMLFSGKSKTTPAGSISGLAEQRKGIGAGAAAKGAGMKALGTGAGIGIASAGAGAGIMLAAEGISKLADSMSKLTPTQAGILAGIVATLTALPIVLTALAPAILVVGKAATAGSVGLLALGAAFLMIGGGIAIAAAGIGIAAAGIGFMAKGLGEMIEKSKGAGDAMLSIGLGVGVLSMTMMNLTAVALGLGIFALTMNTIAKNADAMERIGNAFANIKAVMSGSKDDFIAVENAVKSISNMNASGGGMLAELATLLKTPLKVEFVNNTVPIKNNITLELDGKTLLNKSLDGQIIMAKHIESYHGKNKPS